MAPATGSLPTIVDAPVPMVTPAGRPTTIRFSLTAIAGVVSAIVLTIVAVVLAWVVRRELYTNLDNSLEQRADTYESAFRDNGEVVILLNTNDEDRAAQLVGGDGVVVAATPNLRNAPPIPDEDRPVGGSATRTSAVADLEDDAYRILSRDVELGGESAVLHVAQNVDDLDDTVRSLTIALVAIVPLVVASTGALVWWLVGRTLAPVEQIRTEADEISGTDLRRRLTVPEHADEIARLAATMNQMLDRIDGAGRRQRQFVADASHELRTPLTRIRTELEVDRRHPELSDAAATNAAVLKEAIALQELLDDLLFLARSDEGQQRLRVEPLDLDDIVLREAARRRGRSSIAIDAREVGAAHLFGDAGQLTRVVRNLLDNAMRHATSTVRLTLQEAEGSVRLVVADDGLGVPAQPRDQIFERFARADGARARTDGGTGLGLAIVRDIVERHGGTVRHDRSFTSGARFIVELPTTASG